jgi:ABC-type multidrug transport system fused ATPase/permease subunit
MLLKLYIRLLSFTKPYLKQVFFVWIIVAAAAAFTMIQPKLLQWAVDQGLKPSSTTSIAADAQPSATQIQVKKTTGLSPGDVILAKSRTGTEKLKIDAIDGKTLTVERGFGGTTPLVLTSGMRVQPETQTFGGKTSTLLLVAAAIIGAAAFRGFCTYWQTFMGEWLGQHVAFDLRNRIYEKLQRLSYAYHDKQQTGQLMSRATQDVEATRMFIQMGALRLLDMALRIAFAAGLMFTTDWKLAILAWLLLPAVAWRSIVVNLQMRKIWNNVQEQLGRTTTVLQENLVGVRVVKAFSREDYEEEKFNKEATELFKWNFAQNRLQATNTPFYTAMGMLAQVLVLFVGATWITHNSILGVSDNLTAGELTGFIAYLTLLLMPMRMLGFVVSQFSRAGAAGARIFEILDAESAVKEKPNAIVLENIKGHVRYNHVSFGYDAISPVLHDVNIDAPPGKVVALLGPTGCGKTTVVNLLPRFYDVTSGSITIDGIDIRDVTLASLRKNIGIIQQDVFLFSATIRDNIAYGAVDATYEQIIEAAKIARIHDYIMSLPDGYDTWVGERGITLSGGQKQRVSIARTLLLDPKILILDDSTSSVDTQTEYLIQQALSAVMKGRTTLVIAQRLRTIKNADEILVMQNGKIIEQGTHEQLIEQEGLYRQIYDLELRDQEEALKGMAAAAAAEEAAGNSSSGGA